MRVTVLESRDPPGRVVVVRLLGGDVAWSGRVVFPNASAAAKCH